MPGAAVFRLETINESGLSGAESESRLKGRDLSKLQNELAKIHDAIIDVGVSNVEPFVYALNAQYEAHLDIDFFVVPIKANAHSQIEMAEAVKSLRMLSEIGIEPERIKVVFNMLPAGGDVKDECKVIFNMHKKEPIFTLNEKAVIHESEAFSALASVGKSYLEMLSDTTQYRAELAKIPLENEKARVAIVRMMRAQGTTIVMEREMSACWTALFGDGV